VGGVTTVTCAPRNTTIPTKEVGGLPTAEDNQATVEIHVLQAAAIGARQPTMRKSS